MRYVQQNNRPTKGGKTDKPRDIPSVGKYTVKDLQSPGVKSGIWEKKND